MSDPSSIASSWKKAGEPRGFGPGSGPKFSEIIPRLFIGTSSCTYRKFEKAVEVGKIDAVLSLVQKPPTEDAWVKKQFTSVIEKDRHMWLQCEDSKDQDLLKFMEEACNFVDRMIKEPSEKGILIHCDQSKSRSATVIIAYLMREFKKKFDPVGDNDPLLKEVQGKHGEANPSDNFKEQLKVWGDAGYKVWQDAGKTIREQPYDDWFKKNPKAETQQFHGLYRDSAQAKQAMKES